MMQPMSSRRMLIVVGGGVAIAAIAWLAWPRGSSTSRSVPADAAPGPRLTPPLSVRKPDDLPAGSVRFALRDRRGAPLAGVELSATPAGNQPAIRGTSGDDGAVALALAPGRYALAIAGHQLAGASELELDGPPDRELVIVADEVVEPPPPPEDLGTRDRSGGVTGVVIGGGARLPDVTVALQYDGPIGPGHPVAHAVAPHPIEIPPRRFVGGGGAFRWPDLPAGGYDVWISSPDWGTARARTTVEPNGWGDASVTLTPAASLSGVVQDGRGVAVAKVIVTAELDGRILDQAITGADGVYLLEELPAGTITVRAHIPGDACEPATEIVSVEAGKRATHRVEMICAWQGH